MRTKTGTTSRASLVVAAAALAGAVLAGCGGGSASASALCKDYAKLGTVSGTDTATLRTAAALYRRLALEAPAAAKADLNTLADDEDKVANGDALSVDNSAAQAASDRADSVLSGKCPGKQQSTPTTGGGNGSSAIFCSDVQASLTVGGDNPGLRGPDAATLQAAAELFRKVAGELPSGAPDAVKSSLNTLADIEIKVKDGTDSNLDADAAQTAASEVRSYAVSVCQQSPETSSTDNSDTNTTDTTDTTDTTTTAPGGSTTDLTSSGNLCTDLNTAFSATTSVSGPDEYRQLATLYRAIAGEAPTSQLRLDAQTVATYWDARASGTRFPSTFTSALVAVGTYRGANCNNSTGSTPTSGAQP